MENQILTVVHAEFEVSGTAAYLAEMGVPVQQIEGQALTQARQAALERVKQQHAHALQQLSGDATAEERDTWPVQLQAALSYTAGTASASQQAMLAALVVEGETPAVLSSRIIAKNQAIQTLIGLAGGLKRRTESAVIAATTTEAITDIMATAAVQMQAAITEYQRAIKD